MSPLRFSTKIQRHSLALGIIYTLAMVVSVAIANYFTWAKDKEMTNSLLFSILLSVVSLYLPLLVFTKYADWKIKEFGFVSNGLTFLIAIPLIAFSISASLAGPGADLQTSLIEAIARTGEELFFRGFVYALVVRVLADRNKRYSQAGAIILSSLAFALVHTQTFLPEHNDTMFGIFLLSLFLAFLRFLSGSILPGIMFHILCNTGEVVSVIFGCVIYGSFVIWSYRKGEDSS